MELRFSNELIEWRGPAPFYFIQTPPDITAEIKVIAAKDLWLGSPTYPCHNQYNPMENRTHT